MATAYIDEKNRSKDEVQALEVAESAREQTWDHPSFAADLFMGKVRTSALFPFPEQSEEDQRIGDEICSKVEAFMKSVDTDKIDTEGEIPPSVMKGLADLGCFGIKIPKKYGGLGLSQVNYLRILGVVAKYCGSTLALLSAHQSIGVPQPLLLFGTEEQRNKYLPRFAKGAVSAFALTEPDVGSDPAKLSTTATPVDNGEAYLLSGTKLWCTNGAIADIMVVMAQTPPVVVRGKPRPQITAFIVEKNMPGFEVLHRCRFMGLSGIQNGLLKFTNVRVPKENIIWGLGKGLKLALVTLNAGRLSIPGGCAGGGRGLIQVAREWGRERQQWGAPVGKHEPGLEKLARISAHTLAIEAITMLGGNWVDGKTQDIRLEAAMAKLHGSIRSHEIVDATLQFRGGRGYEKSTSLKARGEVGLPLERAYRDSRINQIVEGTNEIMRLFISREALDKHLNIAGDVLNPKLTIGKRLFCAIKALGFYAFWYPRQWIHFNYFPRYSSLGKLGSHMRFVKRASHRLARTTFHLMLIHGPKLEKRQLQLGRIVQIGMELFAMAATIGYARSKRMAGKPGIDELADLFCAESRTRICQEFRSIRCNYDKKLRNVGHAVFDGKLMWQEANG